MRQGVVLLGIEGACDYELVVDSDDDSITLWTDGLLLAQCSQGAARHIEHLGSAPSEDAYGVLMPSVGDPTCGFSIVVDGAWFVLLDAEENCLAGLEESGAVVRFLSEAFTEKY